jgi:two-component system CitB family response regulator/two-component system response regulator DcuR
MKDMVVPRVRVLVVEDDLRISELHKRFVDKMDDFEVVGLANTIADAQEMVEILEPDLLLLDLFFPVGNGMDLLHFMRMGKHSCDVILITAAQEIRSLQQAIHGGIFDYIVKPVFLPRFEESLRKYQDYFCKVYQGGTLEQQDVDRLFHASLKSVVQKDRDTPKGIDALTLSKVRLVFESSAERTFNAEEIGKQIGVSRSTARRYLEYLATEGFLMADLIYGVVGRPERRYYRRM